MLIRSHVRPVVILLSSLWLAACGGGGGFIEIPDEEPDQVFTGCGTDIQSRAFKPNVSIFSDSGFSISGQISMVAGITVDGDINDRFAPLISNNDPANPQVISNTATVHGFASARGTTGNAAEENFYFSADRNDYFCASLQAGQRIQMQVVDFSANDLDLFLFDTSGNGISASQTNGEFEEVVAATAGDYLIHVNAFSGISKYVLQVLPAVEPPAEPADIVPGEVVVQYEPAASIARFSTGTYQGPQVIRLNTGARALSSLAEPDPLQSFNPELYEKIQTLIEAKRISQQEGVKWAEPNYIVKPTLIPNDSLYTQQWHYPAINLPQAWDISTGEAAPEVIVAVIDTGVYLDHSDFAGKLVSGYDFISSTSIARDGNGIDSNPDDPGDSDIPGASSWHGTHVAGTVAANSNNGIGVAGVSWGTKIMPLRALGKGGGTTADVAQGILFAAGLPNASGVLPARKADIINLSLGSSQRTDVEESAIAAAIAEGVIIVAAAGNSSTSANFYPAAYPGVIGVSATNPQGTKASYSNFGDYVDVAAPGGEMRDGISFGVLSTVANDSTGTRRPAYAFQQGTSMAAPHVAGVIALMKAANPSLTSNQVAALLANCSITNKSGEACNRDTNLGYGIIDAYLAVTEALALADDDATIPAIVGTSRTQLNLGTGSVQDFVLSNIGGSRVTGLTVTVSSGSSWLSVVEQSVNSEKLGTYRATVNRTGLVNGRYNGIISVSYRDSATPDETKSLQINLTMQVGALASPGTIAPQYVLLEDADCTDEDCVVQTVFADSSTGYFVFNDVSPGNYRLYAGSDIDVDGLICGAGETCGAYPTTGSVQIIEVSDSNVTGINFLLNLNGAGGVASSGTLQIQKLQPAGQPGKAR